jgi:hypothetical protein
VGRVSDGAPYDAALDGTHAERRALVTTVFTDEGVRRAVSDLLVLPPAGAARAVSRVGGVRVRSEPGLCAVALERCGRDGACACRVGCAAQSVRLPAGRQFRSAGAGRQDGLLDALPHLVALSRVFAGDRGGLPRHLRGRSGGALCRMVLQGPVRHGRWVPLRFRLELEQGSTARG